MTTTVFTDYVTPVPASWLNDVDTSVYTTVPTNTTNIATNTANLANHIADTTDAHAASAITNTAAGNIVATTVQAAINELDTEKAALAGSASQTFSVAAATAAAHAVRLDQFEGWATFSPTVTANAGTWGTPTVNTARWLKVGKLLHLALNVSATVATGSPTSFRITLPNSLSCPSWTTHPAIISDNGTRVVGACHSGYSGLETKLLFELINAASFNGAGPTIVYLSATIEVS